MSATSSTFLSVALAAVAALVTVTAWATGPEKPMGNQQRDVAALRLRCEQLSRQDRDITAPNINRFLNELAHRKDTEALRLIVTGDMPGSNFAAGLYVESVDFEEGFRFTRTLRIGSRAWAAALWRLSNSGRTDVRAYVRQVATMCPGMRAWAYTLAYSKRWDDFLDMAWADLDSNELTKGEGLEEQRLGDLAREYLEKFEKRRLIPPPIDANNVIQ